MPTKRLQSEKVIGRLIGFLVFSASVPPSFTKTGLAGRVWGQSIKATISELMLLLPPIEVYNARKLFSSNVGDCCGTSCKIENISDN